MRRFGDALKSGQVYRHRPGVYAILPLGDRLLLTFQAEPEPEIQLPGGGIDPGENPVQALHREVFEETGWRIAAPLRLGAYRRFAYMPEYDLWAEKVCHIYMARPIRPYGPPSEPGHTALFLTLEEAIAEVANDGERSFLVQL